MKSMSRAGINRSPCKSCPYRQDVPSGIWDESEYRKLLDYDEELPIQPLAVFMCHQSDGCLCRGWLDTHGDLASVRLAMHTGLLDPDDVCNALDEGPVVPVFASGREAAEHGMRDIEEPSDRAFDLMDQIIRKRGL
jgi:hypothetical protein